MPIEKFIIGMRDSFFDALYEYAVKDKNVIIISADNGAPSLDKFHQNLKNQFFTVGIAEQQMMGMACGMATEGKKVYTYAIAPFVTTRVHEFNKLAQCAMNLPIVNLGVGAGYAYDIMGPSHHTVEDISIMRVLPNLKIYSPSDSNISRRLAEISYNDSSPQYIRFDRTGIPNIYDDKNFSIDDGMIEVKKGKDMTILTTGIMVHQAIKVCEELGKEGIDVGIIDIFRLKPVNKDLLLKLIREVPQVISLEEHLLAGGLGSIIAEIFVDSCLTIPLLRIGQDDRFVFQMGGRKAIWEQNGLDVPGILEQIYEWRSSSKIALSKIE